MKRIAAIAFAVSLVAGCAKTAPVRLDPGGPDADTDADGDGDSDTAGDSDTGSEAPAAVWVRRAGGPGEEEAFDVAIAADGTSIAVGMFEQTAIFGQGEPNETALVSAGEEELFVAAYNATGALRWARRAGGAGADVARGVAAFADGSSVVTGYAGVGAVFGQGEPNETTIPWNSAPLVFFVAWYAADGGLLDVRCAAGEGVALGFSAAALEDGSAIVAGHLSDSVILGEGEPGETVLTAPPGTARLFVARYGPSHALVFARAMEGDGSAFPFDVAAFPDGSFALAGAFTDTLVLGPGEPNETTFVSDGGYDLLVARFGADGALAWARRSVGAAPQFDSDDKANAIGRLGAAGIVVSGFYGNSIIFAEGEPEETTLTGYLGGMFVAAYEADGALAWAVKAGKGQGYALASVEGEAGPIYAAGLFGGFDDTMTFGAGTPEECTLATAGEDDIALARYDSSGGVVWARSMGGVGDEKLGALAAMPGGSPVLVGTFEETAKFDLGLPAEDTIVSAGASDLFIARIAP
jgi:hypothetical protein